VKLVILPTDALIWLIVLVLLALLMLVRRQPMLAQTWRKVFLQPAAMVSFVLLMAFAAIALLDSVHLEPAEGTAAGPQSLLDRAVAPLVEARERRYSAPLAWQSFRKESIERNGHTVRDYPRLKHGGAHLTDPRAQWGPDVRARLGKALLVAGAIAALLYAAMRAAFAGSPLPWRAACATLAMLGLLASVAVELSSGYHLLGTDRTGNSVLWVALKSVRTALVIGVLTTLVVLPLALGLGVAAGYYPGWVDEAIQYVYTLLSSIPDVLLIAAAVLLLQVAIDTRPELFASALERSDARLLFLCLILGITAFTGLCRLVRGEAMKLRELEYVQAARAFGVPAWRILARHIVPNLMHIVMISLVMQFSGFVLAEAVLSYVGVGVDPKTPSFGVMINSARAELAATPVVWWTLSTAFSFMLALVLSANLFADAVRDAFDPRARTRG